MEGLGYWLFLLILYLLSAMMKRRQQKVARRSIEGEKQQEGQPPDWAQSDFFKSLFGDLAQEPLVEPEAEYEDEIQLEEESYLPEEVYTEPVEQESKTKRPSRFEESTVTPYEQHAYSGKWEQLFADMEGIRRAIVLKEILDRPRALNRRIRH